MNIESFLTARRSRYQLDAQLPVSEEIIKQQVQLCLKHTPSAFNMQSSRLIWLGPKSHQKLWEIVLEKLRSIVPADKFAATEEKIQSFAAAYGTLLYWEDQKVVQTMQKQYAAYADNFPIWAQQANGMLQFAVWSVLSQLGVGASLQHYNPLIDEAVKKEFTIPASWHLVAQMPFGRPTDPAGEKTFLPIEKRFLVKP